MSSTKYPCYDSPVHIPGVPGVFSGVIVEVDDASHEVLGIYTFDGQPVPEPTQPSTPKDTKAPDAAKASPDTTEPKE
jgi:hypothetical protein